MSNLIGNKNRVFYQYTSQRAPRANDTAFFNQSLQVIPLQHNTKSIH